MALPNPNQYQAWSRKEAVGTAFSATILQMQMNMLMKSPLLRMVPGSGMLKERAEFKKRELYERTGRDETGRKLTKQEYEDRAKRRKDLGALGDIRDLLDKWKDEGVPVYMVDSPSKKLGSGKQKVVGSSSAGGAYALEDEEAKAEAKKDQQEEDDRIEKKQETFFTKLFGGKKGGGKEGGMLAGLMSMLSPILDLFKGGLSGLVSSLTAPLLAAITGAISGIGAALGPLLMSLAPLVIPFLIAAGLGYLVKSVIDENTENMDEAGKREGTRGSVWKDINGVKVPMETIDGKETGNIHDTASPAQYAAWKQSQGGNAELAGAEGAMLNATAERDRVGGDTSARHATAAKKIDSDLQSIDGMMNAFARDLGSRAQNLDAPGVPERLAGQWNDVRKKAVDMMAFASQNGMEIPAGQFLEKLTSKYKAFDAMFYGGEFGGTKASVGTTGLLNLPTKWSFWNPSGKREIWSPQTSGGAADTIRELSGVGPTSASIPAMSSENSALQSMPSGGGNVTVAPTNVQTNSTVNTMGAVSAPRTGADTGYQFSGFHLVPGLR